MLAAMLEVAKGKVTKTKIMYIAFLSYGQLKGYLFVLVENNLMNIWMEIINSRLQKKD